MPDCFGDGNVGMLSASTIANLPVGHYNRTSETPEDSAEDSAEQKQCSDASDT